MKLFFQIIIIAYLFLLVPVCFGILEAGIFRKVKKGVAEIVTNGYLLTMALFCPIAAVMILKEQSLSELTKIWIPIALMICVISIIIGHQQAKEFLKDIVMFWKGDNTKHGISKWAKYSMLIAIVLSMIVSIGFTRPNTEDATLEIINTSLTTGTMYACDPYTGYLSEYAAEGHVFSAIEMFYAIAADSTGIQSSVCVYYCLPVSLLLFFFLGYWRLGKRLFQNEGQIVGFELFVIAIYWMTTYQQEKSVLTGIFLNSWNGMTLLSCAILPITFGSCAAIMREAEAGIKMVEHKLEKICMAAVLVLAGQLTYYRGGLYVLLMFFLSAAVIIVRKGYDYVVTSGCFKKRI